MWKQVTEHPLVSSTVGILLFFFAAYPVFFGDEPLGSVLSRKGWVLTMPSWNYSLVLILGCLIMALQAVLIRTTLRHRREVKEALALPTDSNGEAKSQPPLADDTLRNSEEKERFRLFTQQVMHLACYRMQWMANQVHGKIFNGPVTTREERLLHYSVDAYRFFMQSLENREEILRDFLAARELLRNDDFLFVQRLFIDLYNVYEHRRPWLRDMAWETFPNVSTYSAYTDWEKADHTMREELIKLLCDCPVLRDHITDLTPPTPRRWEQGGS